MENISQKLFSEITSKGVCTLVVPGKPSWNPDNNYFKTQREASLRGINIQRYFLFPLRHLVNDPIVLRHIKLDQESGIKTKLLYIGELLKNGKIPSSIEFSIWDEGLLLTNYFSEENHTPIDFLISANEEDIEEATIKLDFIINNSQEIYPENYFNNELNIEEPMLATAPVADFLSKVLCKGNHVNTEDCQWYHSIWQYLRILDLVSTPTWHADFYINELKKLGKKKDEKLSILISGTADYSTLAHVLWAFKDLSNSQLSVSVIDLCETPLFLCKWYGKNLNREVVTINCDLFHYCPEDKFDIIVTDAFLTRFNLEDRKAIIQKWYALLNDDGAIVTSVRIGGSNTGMPRKGSIESANVFEQNIKSVGKRWKEFLPITIEEIQSRGRFYALNMISYSAGSILDVRTLFESIGFKIIISDKNNVKGELEPTTYLDIVAKKIN
jgi:hypothetical protein